MTSRFGHKNKITRAVNLSLYFSSLAMKIVKTNLIYFESGLPFVCLCKDNRLTLAKTFLAKQRIKMALIRLD